MSVIATYDRNGDGEMDMQIATTLFPEEDEKHPEHRVVKTLVDTDFDGDPDSGLTSVLVYDSSKKVWVSVAAGPLGVYPDW